MNLKTNLDIINSHLVIHINLWWSFHELKSTLSWSGMGVGPTLDPTLLHYFWSEVFLRCLFEQEEVGPMLGDIRWLVAFSSINSFLFIVRVYYLMSGNWTTVMVWFGSISGYFPCMIMMGIGFGLSRFTLVLGQVYGMQSFWWLVVH